jgi:hypothetical protein
VRIPVFSFGDPRPYIIVLVAFLALFAWAGTWAVRRMDWGCSTGEKRGELVRRNVDLLRPEYAVLIVGQTQDGVENLSMREEEAGRECA